MTKRKKHQRQLARKCNPPVCERITLRPRCEVCRASAVAVPLIARLLRSA